MKKKKQEKIKCGICGGAKCNKCNNRGWITPEEKYQFLIEEENKQYKKELKSWKQSKRV